VRIRPDTLILGSQAASIFASNKSVQAERNLMAYTQMTAPQYQDAAVTFLGRYAGLDVFEYNGVYIVGDANNQDVAQDFLTPATAILASSQAAGTMTYGAISLVEDEGIAIYAAERVADSFANKGGGTWTQRVSSRYAPCPGDSSSWQTFTVVAPAP
jgi:Phage major capsid protein E